MAGTSTSTSIESFSEGVRSDLRRLRTFEFEPAKILRYVRCVVIDATLLNANPEIWSTARRRGRRVHGIELESTRTFPDGYFGGRCSEAHCRFCPLHRVLRPQFPIFRQSA